jgi:hypothetical protein
VQGSDETKMREVVVPVTTPVVDEGKKDICGWTQEQRMAAAEAVFKMNEDIRNAILEVTNAPPVSVSFDLGFLLSGGYDLQTSESGVLFASGQTFKRGGHYECDPFGNQSVFAVKMHFPDASAVDKKSGPTESPFVSVWTESQLRALEANGALNEIKRAPITNLSSYGLSCHVDLVISPVSSSRTSTSSLSTRLGFPAWLVLTCSLPLEEE